MFMAHEILPQKDIKQLLETLTGWYQDGNTLRKILSFRNFAQAVSYVNGVAFVAEQHNHHPDIHLYGWKNVSLTLYTHDSGGITELDIRLARAIDSLATL
jgi:4a-hydroxytetrahydrobiopterin dehydratase